MNGGFPRCWDPERVCYGSFAPFWVRKGYKDTYDWSYAYGLTYAPKAAAILVSVCHQDAGLMRLAPLK